MTLSKTSFSRRKPASKPSRPTRKAGGFVWLDASLRNASWAKASFSTSGMAVAKSRFTGRNNTWERTLSSYSIRWTGPMSSAWKADVHDQDGEISVKIDQFILCKALRPPSEKWHGLEDTEIRYRQRYLDLMANLEVKDVCLKRSQIIREIRNYLHDQAYIEVETPMMQSIPGGAAALPFTTHHNALNCQFYMRIALELYLKRLLVGGMDRVFEIGKNFRNEGISRRHNPEFTMLEAYQAYGDYQSMMDLVQGMITHVAEKVLGTLVIEHKNRDGEITRTIDLTPPWKTVPYKLICEKQGQLV